MDEIGKVLPSLFRKQIARAEPHVLEILLPLWPRIVGRMMAQHSHPAVFAFGVLTLNADSATWSAQLRHMADQIRAGINAFLGQATVKSLRIRTVGQQGRFAPTRPECGAASPAPLRADKAMNTDSIADPEIAAALENSFAKYFNRPGKA